MNFDTFVNLKDPRVRIQSFKLFYFFKKKYWPWLKKDTQVLLFIINIEQISHLFLVYLLLTLNK